MRSTGGHARRRARGGGSGGQSGAAPRHVSSPAWPVRPPRPVPEVEAVPDLVVEHAETTFTGAIVGLDKDAVTLDDGRGRRRLFPLVAAAFAIDGVPVTLVRPAPTSVPRRTRTASGSVAVRGAPTRTAVASRIYVEGRHDAELVERVWGDDLRVEGVVVEYLGGLEQLPAVVRSFAPAPGRRLGVLVDHLVPGSKESRIVAAVRLPHVLVTGHPYVDIWQAVKPAAVGIAAWPHVPRGQSWKEGVAQTLGWDVPTSWRRVRAGVRSYADLETPFLGAVERLIDFVTQPG